MDPSAVNWNVTIDDFDSVLTYADQAVWDTPDPSSFDNYSSVGSPWIRGTYHATKVKGATVSLNITGPAIYVYGNTGPDFGSYEIEIDSVKIRQSAYSATASNASTLLYGASNLSYKTHNIVLRNLGALTENGDKGGDRFLLDYITSTIQVAPAGATARNITLEETDSSISYSGTWGKNSGTVFSGGGTTFTNGDQASFSVNFKGSSIMVLGDKKNDHGLFSVVLDDRQAEVYNGVSGCGGAFGMTCEQQVPTIKYLASNLDGSDHKLTLTNQAGAHKSFFDLDSIVVVVPSEFGPRQLSSDASPFLPTSSAAPGSTAPPSASSTKASAATNTGGTIPTSAAQPGSAVAWNPLFLLTLSIIFLFLRPAFRR